LLHESLNESVDSIQGTIPFILFHECEQQPASGTWQKKTNFLFPSVACIHKQLNAWVHLLENVGRRLNATKRMVVKQELDCGYMVNKAWMAGSTSDRAENTCENRLNTFETLDHRNNWTKCFKGHFVQRTCAAIHVGPIWNLRWQRKLGKFL
jgi:hypothetical protein